MLLAGEFAGWEYGAPYGEQTVYRAGSIGLIGSYLAVIAALAALFVYSGLMSYQCLRPGVVPGLRRRLQAAFYTPLLSSLASVAAGTSLRRLSPSKMSTTGGMTLGFMEVSWGQAWRAILAPGSAVVSELERLSGAGSQKVCLDTASGPADS